MREYKEVVETVVRDRLVSVTCELCKAKNPGDDWGSGYQCRSTVVECEDGHRWPDASDGERYTVDICPDCFVDKLIPWIESQGGQVTRHDL